MSPHTNKAEALRRDFDQAFAAPPPGEPEARVRLLVVRLGEARVAVRLGELGGVHPLARVVPLPGADAALLGLAGVRGELVAIYDLAAILGLPEAREVRWAAIAGDASVAFAFDAVETTLSVTESAIRRGDNGQSLVPELVDFGGSALGVLRLDAVLARLGLAGA